MLLLTTTSTIVRVVTSSTADLDTFASYVDKAGATITEGSEAHARTSAATHTVLAAPAASTSRAVKLLCIRNKHATTSNTIQLQFYDGSTAFEIFAATLPAQYALYYTPDNGFWVVDSQGRQIANTNANGQGAAVNATNLVVLASPVTNNNGTPNTIADVTGLSFNVTAGETYWFRFNIAYTAAATTTGSRWSINGPSITALAYRSVYSLGVGSITINEGLSTYDTPAASNATSAATGANIAIIEGLYTAGANGTVIARFASEVASSAIVALAGSLLEWYRVL